MKSIIHSVRQGRGCAKIKKQMKYIFKPRQIALGLALLLAAINSQALTLGRPRGPVLIGQPVDVSIPVRVETDEDASAQCYEADVFLGDTRVTGGRTSVTLEPGASAQDMIVRVRSTAVVDEPVISIYLRAGCAQRSTRRYVLLADVASDVVSPLNLPSLARPVPLQSAQPPAATRPSVSRALPAARSSAAPAVASDTAPTQAAADRRRQRREAREAQAAQGTPTASTAPKSAATVAAASVQPTAPAAARDSVVRRKGAGAAARSRLKLDALDLLMEVDPVLKSSTVLQTPVTENPQARAEAAALWRAINATPLDILRETQRLQSLEADMKSLRDATTKNQASLADVQARLQKAESERYANVLVYSLGGLLLAALALAGLFWWRGRNSGGQKVWWTDRAEADYNYGTHEIPLGPDRSAANALSEVDVDLGMDENMFATLKPPGAVATPIATPPPHFVSAQPPQHPDFGSSLPGIGRAVNAEELFDIQQQADFFISLGQHDQAIEILKNHISDNVETSALAYLDLLKIYHSLDRREDYDLLRGDFNRVFNAQVPPFDSYTVESNGLEDYHMAMSRIVALWPSAKVLEIIEDSIFRKPGTGDGEAFDLEAYRELLLLYAIAKEVIERQPEPGDFDYSSTPQDLSDSRQGQKSRFSVTAIQPLSAANYSETSPAALLPEIPLPRPSPRLGIDIDLDEPGQAAQPVDIDVPAANFEMHDFNSELLTEDVDSKGNSGTLQTPKDAQNSQMIDFDLFDEATESQYSSRMGKLPKS